MRAIRRTAQFRKDVKRAQRRGKDFGQLKEVIEKLVREEPEERRRDHALVGALRGARVCHIHIEPDWLLIYEITEDELVLIRTGTHADLFKK